MVKAKCNLSLDQQATYEIKVPGVLQRRLTDMNEKILITVSNDGNLPVTTLTVTLDQAGLHGLLRRLYSLGLPLISINCVEIL